MPFVKPISDLVGESRMRLFYPELRAWGESGLDPVYAQVAEEIASLVEAGNTVSYAARGDAGLFSPFAYLENPLIRRGIDWEWIPGISFLNAAVFATVRTVVDDQSTLLAGKLNHVSDLDRLFSAADTLVIFDLRQDQLAELQAYVREKGIGYAKFIRVGSQMSDSSIQDILSTNVQIKAGLLLLKRN
jgi:precorrin-2 methylase